MTIRLLKITFLFLLVLSTKQGYSSFYPLHTKSHGFYNPERSKVYIGLCVGHTSYFGDLDNNSLHIPFYRPFGAQILMEREVFNSLRLSVGFFMGNIYGDERTAQRNLNFKTSLLAPHIGLSCKLAQFYQRRLSLFLFAGAEMIFFNASGDLKNTIGETYYYWADGTVRNLPDIPSNQSSASVIKPDLKYEADYRNLNFDNVSPYPRTTLAIPAGLFIDANLNRGFDLRVGATYHYTFTDYLDNITANSIGSRKGNAATDKFLFSYVGIIYNLPVAKANRPSTNSCGFKEKEIDHKKSVKRKRK